MNYGCKRVVCMLFVLVFLAVMCGCGSSEPCENCGKTPTKGYTNEYSGEKDYFCSECSSQCILCSEKATEHYTSALGIIVFACHDCYQDILDLNS